MAVVESTGSMHRAQPDIAIIGGGTAGCVLAARLSEDPRRRVLLIEAGHDYPPGKEPASILDPFPSSYGDPRFSWPDLVAEVGAPRPDGGPRAQRNFVQGRGIGGSSSIMGMMASRGSPADYDAWEAQGATGWSWEGVLPYFRKLETDLDFDGPLHGKDGPIPIRRHVREQWAPFARAVATAVESRGFAWRADYNAEFADGLSALPMNNLPERRVSAASGYLNEVVRRRPNLEILANRPVRRLLFDGTRLCGLEFEGGNRMSLDQAVLCAGAIHSPVLLMRSGIGPAAELAARGVPIVADRAGVGRNLRNHVIVHLAVHLPAHATQDPALRAWASSILRFSSHIEGCGEGDLHIFPSNKASWHPLGRRIGALGMGLRKPFSAGSVSLADRPFEAPRIRFNILDDARDLARMMDAVALGAALLADPKVRRVRNEVFLPAGGQANALNRPTSTNYWKSLALSTLFDLSGALRRVALRRWLVDVDELIRDAEARRALVLRQAAPVHHPCGTCRMGAENDPLAVLDARCRVLGVEGLRVVDASIMPDIVTGNTHLPVLMAAEKAATMIASGA